MISPGQVLYSGFHGEFVHVIDFLARKHGWLPGLVISRDKTEAWLKNNYGNCPFIDSMELRRACFDYSFSGGKVCPVDAGIISALGAHENYTYDLMEDASGWDFSFLERRRYYYDLLNFLNTVIKHVKPQACVFSTWPHTVVDYVLYYLCQFYGIPILFPNPVPLFNCNGKKYHYVATSIDDHSSSFYPLYASGQAVEQREDLREYFQMVRSKSGQVPPYIKFFWNNPKRHWNPGFRAHWVRETWRILKLSLTGEIFQPVDVAWKKNRMPLESKASRMNYIDFLWFKERLRRSDAALRRDYDSFVTKPDLNCNYVYMAASFHPEAGVWTTYQDQLLLLDVLSASIPEGWIIYYKEHPSTFFPGDKASFYKNYDFFRRVSQYRNVRMISSEENTFQLMDSSRAVVTAGGTVGWEALLRGKPAVIFGHAWYEGCKSVLKVETLEDCRQAFKLIEGWFLPDTLDVEYYAAVVASVAGRDLIHGNFLADQLKQARDPIGEMHRIGHLIYDTYCRCYGGEGIKSQGLEMAK